MKEIISFIISLVLFVLFINWLSGDLEREYTKRINNYKQYVGKKVIISKDTLLITDYSYIMGVLYLNNGTKISKEFAEQVVIKNDSL